MKMRAVRRKAFRRCGVALVLAAGLLSTVVPAQAQDGDTGDLRKQLARSAAPARLQATWYRPVDLQDADVKKNAGKKYPLAVVLATKNFPATNDDYWIQTLWKKNFCTLVLTCETGDFSTVRLGQVLRYISQCPPEVPADVNRLLVLADTTSGPLALRMLDGCAGRMVGGVLISISPVEITSQGPAMWSPRPDVWKAPLWAVVGTRIEDAAGVLELWRKLGGFAPAEAPLTIDTRIGRGMGHLLPDKAVEAWLGDIAAGKPPPRGPDRQAEAQKKQFAPVAQKIRLHMKDPPAPAGEKITKSDGPFRVSLVAPQGWLRDKTGERAYNLYQGRRKAAGAMLSRKNPYAEIYLSPKLPGRPFFARTFSCRWNQTADKLLENSNRRLARRGHLTVLLEQWSEGRWAYQVSVIMSRSGGKWHRWVTLTAGTAGGAAGTFIMVMDASDSPDPLAMAAAMKRLTQSLQVDCTAPRSPTLGAP